MDKPPDHWFWCAMGFQGLVGMLEQLNASNLKASPETVAFLRAQYERLGIVIGDQTPPKDDSHASTS